MFFIKGTCISQVPLLFTCYLSANISSYRPKLRTADLITEMKDAVTSTSRIFDDALNYTNTSTFVLTLFWRRTISSTNFCCSSLNSDLKLLCQHLEWEVSATSCRNNSLSVKQCIESYPSLSRWMKDHLWWRARLTKTNVNSAENYSANQWRSSWWWCSRFW